jgi:hypothetical protein
MNCECSFFEITNLQPIWLLPVELTIMFDSSCAKDIEEAQMTAGLAGCITWKLEDLVVDPFHLFAM